MNQKDTEFIENLFKHHDFAEITVDELLNTEFVPTSKVHDWRNYVSDYLIVNWQKLTHRERCIIYCYAKRQADNEEWE